MSDIVAIMIVIPMVGSVVGSMVGNSLSKIVTTDTFGRSITFEGG